MRPGPVGIEPYRVYPMERSTVKRACSQRQTRVVKGMVLSLGVLFGPLTVGHGAPPAVPTSTPGIGQPVRPADAAARLSMPPGFVATLCASEPEVVQPIAMTIDPRGRLWVVENYSYPIWLNGPRGRDRVLIFEDVNGDGRFDRRTVFYEGGTNFTGIEFGFGGVWVCATPNLLFIPDRDGDDRPDGPPVVKLDGWNTNAQHNLFNGLKWGPDGYLWGCHGIIATSLIGKPGTPDAERVAINCSVWRYHPVEGRVEAVAHGTTNPWGLDFDEFGEAYITNCVIAHLFRVIPGSHFDRMFGNDLNPYVYELMKTCADHLHWAGGKWQDSRGGWGEHGALGGGHAHVGGMIYLGDNWPAKYRGSLFTCNIHGHRVNNDRFDRDADGYRVVAKHAPDFVSSSDPWFRGLELKYGPDGGVYLTDWSDVGECHENDADNAHRENGRIFKITYGTPKIAPVDLARESSEALAQYQSHPNEWFARTARRLLQERTADGKSSGDAKLLLVKMVDADPDVTHKLRALWTLFAIGALDETSLLARIEDKNPHVRAWAIRLLLDNSRPSQTAIDRLVKRAGSLPGPGSTAATAPSEIVETNPLVRLNMASGLQHVPLEHRWPLAEALALSADYVTYEPHSLLIWYGIEPLIAKNLDRSTLLLKACPSPLVSRLIARRMVEANTVAGLAAVLPLIGSPQSTASWRDSALVDGVLEALRGRTRVEMPATWSVAFQRLAAKGEPSLAAKAGALGLLFGDPQAEISLRGVMEDRHASVESRQFALENLVERRTASLSESLIRLLNDSSMRGMAIRGLAAYRDPATPRAILDRYATLLPAERDDAIATLVSRPAWAKDLLEAVRGGKVSPRDLSTTVARQVLAFRDDRLTVALEQVWGKLRATSGDKVRLIDRYKNILAARDNSQPDPGHGRQLFSRMCGQCHRLFGEGGTLGPDLTGSDRANIDYILENVLDPSASVGKFYTLTTVATSEGRLVAGVLKEQTPAAVVIQTAAEIITIPRSEVEGIQESNVSMMPEGQLEPLSSQEVRDLFAYLASSHQVPLPEKTAAIPPTGRALTP
jgi:putative membrane-bound dehydrogenase-like protein